MKKFLKRDINYRKKFYKFYIKLNCFKYLHSNKNLNITINRKAFNILKNLPKGNKYKNRCIISLRSHSVLNQFKLSRILFRKFLDLGLLSNLKKSSW